MINVSQAGFSYEILNLLLSEERSWIGVPPPFKIHVIVSTLQTFFALQVLPAAAHAVLEFCLSNMKLQCIHVSVVIKYGSLTVREQQRRFHSTLSRMAK